VSGGKRVLEVHGKKTAHLRDIEGKPSQRRDQNKISLTGTTQKRGKNDALGGNRWGDVPSRTSARPVLKGGKGGARKRKSALLSQSTTKKGKKRGRRKKFFRQEAHKRTNPLE